MKKILTLSLVLMLITPIATEITYAAISEKDADILITKLKQINYTDNEKINDIINRGNVLPEIIKRQNNAAEKRMSLEEYSGIFFNSKKIKLADRWIKKNNTYLEAAEEKYNVDKEIIAAILLIETKFNTVAGRYRVMDALVTRIIRNPKLSTYFTKQIPAWIEIADTQGFDIFDKKSSYAGAMGMPQFMPSSYLDFAADGDGDGIIDIWNNNADVIFSVAKYFHDHGWKKDEMDLWIPTESNKIYNDRKTIKVDGRWITISNNIKVIQKYNSSILYALTAASIYEELKAHYFSHN